MSPSTSLYGSPTSAHHSLFCPFLFATAEWVGQNNVWSRLVDCCSVHMKIFIFSFFWFFIIFSLFNCLFISFRMHARDVSYVLFNSCLIFFSYLIFIPLFLPIIYVPILFFMILYSSLTPYYSMYPWFFCRY